VGSSATREPLRESPLAALHRELGARLTAFAGWQLPLHYPGKAPVSEEHLAVRRRFGLFDVSHMARFQIDGSQAERLLERVCTADVAAQPPGSARYTLLLEERGFPLDDAILYRLQHDRFLLVANAANRGRVGAWLAHHRDGLEATVAQRPPEEAMVAVQGPAAEGALAALGLPTPPAGGVTVAQGGWRGLLVCATGYTGERGFELIGEGELVSRIWRELVGQGGRPAGLAARDSLRIEAGLPLYGNELREDRCPLTLGLGRFIRERGGFIGAEALQARAEELRRDPQGGMRLAQFVAAPGPIPRSGDRLLEAEGTVTSGTYSPLLERPVGLAYLSARLALPGSRLQIAVRGRVQEAEVVKRPAHRHFKAG